MKAAWLLSLFVTVYAAVAGQKAQAPLFLSPREDFSEQEGVLIELGEDEGDGAPKRWDETEVRCGVLTLHDSAQSPPEIDDYSISRPCMIARPYLGKTDARVADAGWDYCGFTNQTTEERHKVFAKKVLAPNVGNFTCFQGAIGGLGQFRVYRYVKLKDYRKY